tara:strand:+ start:655 stop:1449 length:795 start_codon:yes stop_codon:yes gene_type:complete
MTNSSKKIVIFTGEDLFYAPILLQDLIKKYKNNICHIYISKSYLSFNRLKKKFKFFLKNNYPFCISLKDWLKFILLHLNIRIKSTIKNKPKSIKEHFTSIGIRSSYVKKVNTKSFYKLLKSHNPDIIILACFDKIVSKELSSIPKNGTYNVHLGKLPDYKGGLSSFWVLRFNDQTAGASIHEVSPEIDSGRLIGEKQFKIKTKSMHELMLKTVDESSTLITKVVENIIEGKIKEINIKHRQSNYYLYPSKLDFKKFYQNGCTLI